MAGRFILVILLLSSALALSSCMKTTSIEGEKIDLRSIQEAAKRGKINEILGEPLEIKDFGIYRIAAHEYRGRTELLLVWPGVPVAFVREYSYLTIAYESDGALLSVETWPGADSPEEAIEMHTKSLVSEEERIEKVEECNAAISEAVNLDRETLLGLKSECATASAPEKRWMLTCLLAHQEDNPSQFDLGVSYHYGQAPGGTNLPKALLWYTLADPSGYVGPGYHHCYHKTDVGFTCADPVDRLMEVESKLDERSIAEVEQQVAAWQPNPAECEWMKW